MYKHGPIYLGGPEFDDKRGLLVDGDEYDEEETVIVYSEPPRRRCRQRRPLQKLARRVMTFGCVCFGVYMGLNHFYPSMFP